jgi:hypothetical protein
MFKDFMSYCNPDWISLYHHGKLINNARLNPTVVCIDLPWWKDLVREQVRRAKIPVPPPPPEQYEVPVHMLEVGPSPVISIIGTIEDGRFHPRHVARTYARPEIEAGARTQMVARLRDENGKVLARAPVMRLISQAGCGCNCAESSHEEPTAGPYLVQALMPDIAPGAILEIIEGDKEIWSRKAPARPAAITAFECTISGEMLDAAWRTRPVAEVVECWLRWSSDGETWRALATGLSGNKAAISIHLLPPRQLMIQLVVHDGFFSVASKPVTVEVPPRGPDLSVFHPREGYTYLQGQALRLACAGTSADGGNVEPERCLWILDDKEVGRGLEVWTVAPQAGQHVVALNAHDAYGASEAAVHFATVAPPKPPRARRR